MAHEFQQSHLCGIVELGSVRPSVSCLSVLRIKNVETGINLPVGAVDQVTACTSGCSTYISGLYDEIASRARYDTFSALARYAIVHTGIADQVEKSVERLGYISESHFPTRRDTQCAKSMWLHWSLKGVMPRDSNWRCLWGSATSWGKGNHGSVQCEHSGWYPRFCYNPS